jgi:hypothetical protein
MFVVAAFYAIDCEVTFAAGKEKSQSGAGKSDEDVERVTKKTKEIFSGLKDGDISRLIADYISWISLVRMLCGGKLDALDPVVLEGFKAAVVGYVTSKFEGEALEKANNSTISDKINVIKKGTEYYCKFFLVSDEDGSQIEVAVLYDGQLNVIEITVAGIPIFRGVKTIVSQYCEKKGVKMNKLTPDKRAEVCAEALKEVTTEKAK